MMPANTLSIFKNERPPASFAQHEDIGEDRIFHQTLCTGGAKSYKVAHLNKLYENGENIDNLFERTLSMMRYLQQGYHSGEYDGPAGQYEAASTEYPYKYELLAQGLSDAALDVIEDMNSGPFISVHEEGMGANFCATLIEDRNALTQAHDLSFTP